ncbi:hypothetical protein OPKNFCMD_5756 [Methylobacterium crusticola]|uniref:Transposase n=1 Tax=Methylobacterium crusticola TaxID=1697972 RepID=A0ABQ4R5K5_9HYPH|nr:hypothetical protein OPKNFCMD_5756 [Methylobacterium crusticola]
MKTAFAQAVRLSRIWALPERRSRRSDPGVHLPPRGAAERTTEDWARLGGGLIDAFPTVRSIRRHGRPD